MADFDPDAFLSDEDQSNGDAFDPDAFIASSGEEGGNASPPKQEATPASEPTLLERYQHWKKTEYPKQVAEVVAKIQDDQANDEATLYGAADVASFGLAPKVQAALAATNNALTSTTPWPEAYEAAKREFKQPYKKAQSERPLSYLKGNLIGGVPQAMINPFGRLGAYITTKLAGAAPTLANLTRIGISPNFASKLVGMFAAGGDAALQGALQAAGHSEADTLADRADEAAAYGGVAGVAGAALHVAPEVVTSAAQLATRGAGHMAKLPQQALDAVAEKVGGTRIGQALGRGGEAPDGVLASERVAQLRRDASFTPTDVEDVKPFTGEGLEGRDATAYRLARAAQEGKATVTPSSYTIEPGTGLEDDLARMSSDSRDVAADTALGEGASRKSDPFIRAESEAQDMMDAAATLRGMERETATTSANTANAGAPKRDTIVDAGVYMGPRGPSIKHKGEYRGEQFKFPRDRAGWERNPAAWKRGEDSEMPPAKQAIDDLLFGKNHEGPDTQAAIEALNRNERDASKARWGLEGGQQARNERAAIELEEQAKALREKIAAGKELAATERNEQFGELKQKASEYLQILRDTDAKMKQAAGNRMEQARLQGIADEARASLARIGVGRKALEGLAGSLAGGEIGGVPGALLGYALKGEVGRGAFQGIDIAGAIGQRMSRADIPTLAALADRLATRSDDVGRMARWAIEGGGDAAARLFVLSRVPQVQEALKEEAGEQ